METSGSVIITCSDHRCSPGMGYSFVGITKPPDMESGVFSFKAADGVFFFHILVGESGSCNDCGSLRCIYNGERQTAAILGSHSVVYHCKHVSAKLSH